MPMSAAPLSNHKTPRGFRPRLVLPGKLQVILCWHVLSHRLQLGLDVLHDAGDITVLGIAGDQTFDGLPLLD